MSSSLCLVRVPYISYIARIYLNYTGYFLILRLCFALIRSQILSSAVVGVNAGDFGDCW